MFYIIIHRLLRGPKPEHAEDNAMDVDSKDAAAAPAEEGNGEAMDEDKPSAVKEEDKGEEGASAKEEGKDEKEGGSGDDKEGVKEEGKGKEEGKSEEKGEKAGGPKESEAEKQLKMVKRTVDEVWAKRIEEGDPLEAKCMRKEVRGGTLCVHMCLCVSVCVCLVSSLLFIPSSCLVFMP